ncbi:MAG TPA: TetR/AcrR family transcriptional regulator [Candidatus Acidoferrales bacterium]|nr:TetR/AcrR family transcriptional regulator [Candidatus Acidoferrales bacterium]
MGKSASHLDTRQQLLRAALKHFANSGYAATSVQDIVDEAKLSKPALYYHFKDKAGLFQALVHEAHDERYRILRAATESRTGIGAQLEAALAGLFAYFRKNRELMRISFATMFAAPGEVPEDAGCEEKCVRNFDFVHSLIKAAQKRGELGRHFSSLELAFGLYGLANFYIVGHLVSRDCQPNDLTARRIVELFLAGAGPKPRAKHLQQSIKGSK